MNDRRRRWVAFAAAGWALIFCVFHVVWALGWYVGLHADEARVAFSRPGTLAYDLVVAVMCAIAVPVAIALGTEWGRQWPPRLLAFLAWTGTGLLVLRAAASLVQATYLIATGQFSWEEMGIWEPWFYVGATLFTVTTWQYSRERAS